MDHFEIGFKPARLHARIDGRETAANIDDIDGDAGANDGGTHLRHGIAIGLRAHRLAADVEADAQRIGHLAGGHQHGGGFIGMHAEFRRQAEFGVRGGDAQPHAQREVGRGYAVLRRGGHDLVQLVDAIKAEYPHAMAVIGFGNGLRRLDRVHEAQDRIGRHFAHQAHFGDGGDIIMRQPRIPQGADQISGRVGLDRIHRRARKLRQEEPGRAASGMRADKGNGLRWTQEPRYRQRFVLLEQLKGPPGGQSMSLLRA